MQKEEQRESEDSLVCPSFSTYSSDKLAHVADQVTREDHTLPQNDTDLYPNDNEEDHNQNDDSDFEFVAFEKAADGVFFDRYDGPVFPVFKRDLAGTPPPEFDGDVGGGRISGLEGIRFSMEKLLIGDEENRRSHRDPPSSSSEEEVDDDLDAMPAGTYCVWTPNPVQASPNRCKKSNSTGSSSSPSPAKRWKILNFLRRSKSDGKDSLVFLTPSSSSSSSSLWFGSSKKEKKEKKEKRKEKEGANVKSKEKRGGGSHRNESGGGGVAGKRSPATAVSAHEALYVRNRETRRMDKRRSYLPYKQDLVGFCATLNGMGRTFPSF